MTGAGFKVVLVADLLCPSWKEVSSTFLPLLGPQTAGGWAQRLLALRSGWPDGASAARSVMRRCARGEGACCLGHAASRMGRIVPESLGRTLKCVAHRQH